MNPALNDFLPTGPSDCKFVYNTKFQCNSFIFLYLYRLINSEGYQGICCGPAGGFGRYHRPDNLPEKTYRFDRKVRSYRLYFYNSYLIPIDLIFITLGYEKYGNII
jgi:hypothetical protein